MEERNVGTKGGKYKQGLTNAKESLVSFTIIQQKRQTPTSLTRDIDAVKQVCVTEVNSAVVPSERVLMNGARVTSTTLYRSHSPPTKSANESSVVKILNINNTTSIAEGVILSNMAVDFIHRLERVD